MTCWTAQVRHVVDDISASGNLGPNWIKNLLTFGIRGTDYKHEWPIMNVAVERPPSLYVLSLGIWRRRELLPYRCICFWSNMYSPRFANF